jgi:subtilase family serine protease
MTNSGRIWRRNTAIFGAVVLTTGMILTAATTASAAPKTAPTGGIRYVKDERVCPRPTTPDTMQCYAIAHVTVPKGTAGAHAERLAAGTNPNASGAACPHSDALGFGPSGLGYTPADLAGAYGYNANTSRSKQVIGIIDWDNDPKVKADLNSFDACYGFPSETSTSFRVVNQQGKASPLPSLNDKEGSVEISLDVEAARGVCHTCKVLLVEASSPSDSNLATAENTAARLGATEISNSFGRPEGGATKSTLAGFNHPGVVITASTGDDGWFGWDFADDSNEDGSQNAASFPATDPTVVAVGGTSIDINTNTGARTAERVWNNNGIEDNEFNGATGGGCSTQFTAQAAQSHFPGFPSAGCSGDRLAADVAAIADPETGFDIVDSDAPSDFGPPWFPIGGTSLASPVTAAMFALAGGSGGAAYPATTLYTNAALSPSSLDDIVPGTITTSLLGTVTQTGNSFCDEVSVSTCGANLFTADGTHNPNDLVYNDTQNAVGLLDCSWPHSETDVTASVAKTECNTATGLDGPTGLGTPKGGLRLFTSTAPTVTLTSAAHPKLNSALSFSAQGTELSGVSATLSNSSYAWKFGDGQSGTGATVQHTYTKAGRYTTTLTVTDSMFQIVIKTVTITLGEKASVHYGGPAKLKTHKKGSFKAAGTTTPNTGASIKSYTWKFGDGHTAHGKTAHHAYSHAGKFTVTLTVKDSTGVVTTSTHHVKVTS